MLWRCPFLHGIYSRFEHWLNLAPHFSALITMVTLVPNISLTSRSIFTLCHIYSQLLCLFTGGSRGFIFSSCPSICLDSKLYQSTHLTQYRSDDYLYLHGNKLPLDWLAYTTQGSNSSFSVGKDNVFLLVWFTVSWAKLFSCLAANHSPMFNK